MATAMQITVEGEDISSDEFENSVGWTTAVSKRKSATKNAPRQGDRASPASRGEKRSRTPASVKKRITTASRLPHLPREHIRVIVRPRGGLDIKKVGHLRVAQALPVAANLQAIDITEDIICPNMMQNIMIVSTPLRSNAMAYAGVEAITIGEANYELNAYFAAPENSCKGVFHGVDPAIEQEELQPLIIQPKNPSALEVRRIKNTSTVIILFDGLKVPDYIKCGPSLMKCSLYRRQTDICYVCGRLGHRADVCPAPENVIRRGCGMNNPEDNHVCSPKCTLCGGPLIMADKACKQRYQMPYVVRRRRRRRRQNKQTVRLTNSPAPLKSALIGGSTSRSRSRDRVCTCGGSRGRSAERSTSRRRTASRTRSGSRGRSRSRVRAHTSSSSGGGSPGSSWADRVRNPPPPPKKVTGGPSPEHNRITQLEKENRLLKQALDQLRSEVAALKKDDRKTGEECTSQSALPPTPVVEDPNVD